MITEKMLEAARQVSCHYDLLRITDGYTPTMYPTDVAVAAALLVAPEGEITESLRDEARRVLGSI